MSCPKCGSTLWGGLCPICSKKDGPRKLRTQAEFEARQARKQALLEGVAMSEAHIAELVGKAYQRGYEEGYKAGYDTGYKIARGL